VIADLHAHYAMHLQRPRMSLLRILVAGEREWRTRVQALVLGIANRLANWRTFSSGPRITMSSLRAGNVGVALSVLYQPFDEMDLSKPPGAPPSSDYYPDLIDQLELVEREVAANHSAYATVAHNGGELERALEEGKIALVHAIEGGFHLGASEEEIRTNVAELRRRGVFYVTLAHLFWRQIATNSPAIPFLSDRLYQRLFPQPPQGFGELGRAAVAAMIDEGVVIDVSHMSEASLTELFALLDDTSGGEDVTIIATHTACRFGRQSYNLSDATIRRIAAQGGLVGLIFAEHQMTDGIRRSRTKTFADSFEVLRRHIDHIHDLLGTHEHTAIGSDLDGFIKPTLAGLDDMSQMRDLEAALIRQYGADAGASIASGNAVRVLRECLATPARAPAG
jgi:microsomal dipeptidase-like Zn-dependent dipeptidase